MKNQLDWMGIFLWAGMILAVLYVTYLFVKWVCTIQIYVFWLKKDGRIYVHVHKDDGRFTYYTRVLSCLSSDTLSTAVPTSTIIDLGTNQYFHPTLAEKAINLTPGSPIAVRPDWFSPLLEVLAIEVQETCRIFNTDTVTAHIGTMASTSDRVPIEASFVPLEQLCRKVDPTSETAAVVDLLAKHLENN